jgi:serine O-acetyltransferase
MARQDELAMAIEASVAELEKESSRTLDAFHLDPAEVRATFHQAREILFPEFTGNGSLPLADLVSDWADRVHRLVATERHRACSQPAIPTDCRPCATWAESVARHLVKQLPPLRRTLMTDLQAALASDPAAQGPLEVFLCYPGFQAIISYRIAHVLWGSGARLIARLVSEYAHTQTGIDLHPGAVIDEGFFIDHGTGVVVGETASIGKFVRLYQGVTLGALSLSKEKVQRMHGVKRHPTLEDEVIVYANATILGGDTVVGRGAVIGGNSWITSSISPGTVITQGDV